MFVATVGLAQSQSTLMQAYDSRVNSESIQGSIDKIGHQMGLMYSRLSSDGISPIPVDLNEVLFKNGKFVIPSEIFISTYSGKICRLMVSNRQTLSFDGCR